MKGCALSIVCVPGQEEKILYNHTNTHTHTPQASHVKGPQGVGNGTNLISCYKRVSLRLNIPRPFFLFFCVRPQNASAVRKGCKFPPHLPEAARCKPENCTGWFGLKNASHYLGLIKPIGKGRRDRHEWGSRSTRGKARRTLPPQYAQDYNSSSSGGSSSNNIEKPAGLNVDWRFYVPAAPGFGTYFPFFLPSHLFFVPLLCTYTTHTHARTHTLVALPLFRPPFTAVPWCMAAPLCVSLLMSLRCAVFEFSPRVVFLASFEFNTINQYIRIQTHTRTHYKRTQSNVAIFRRSLPFVGAVMKRIKEEED